MSQYIYELEMKVRDYECDLQGIVFVFLTENRRRQRAHDEYYRQTYTSPYVLVGTHHGSTGRRIKA